MATKRYSCRVADPFGSPLDEIADFVSEDGSGSAMAYALNVGGIGAMQLTVPASYPTDFLQLDGRLGAWYSINGGPPKLDGNAIYLIRRWHYTQHTTTVTAYHANSLMQRRILAYFSGTSYTLKAAVAAGNLIKAFARENMGSLISAANRIGVETQADLSTLLSIQADLADGVSIAAQDSFANLYDLVRTICDASTQAGTYMAAEIVAPTEGTLELRTYPTVRGVDHRASSGQAVILSEATGSLTNCELDIDRTNEVTFAICAGAGPGVNRITATSFDAVRMGESPFNRIEVFGDYTNISDQAVLQDKADALVRAGKPRTEFTADIVDTDAYTRGVEYDLGDLITAEFRNQQYDCRLDVVGVSVGGGKATSKARVRYVD